MQHFFIDKKWSKVVVQNNSKFEFDSVSVYLVFVFVVFARNNFVGTWAGLMVFSYFGKIVVTQFMVNKFGLWYI